MLMKSADLEKAFNLDKGIMGHAMIHEGVKAHYEEGSYMPLYDVEEAYNGLLAYMSYKERLAREEAAKWNNKALALSKAVFDGVMEKEVV